MWRRKKPPTRSSISSTVTLASGSAGPDPVDRSVERALIGKALVFKGKVSGTQDLTVNGQLKGTVSLSGHTVTVDREGRVQAAPTTQRWKADQSRGSDRSARSSGFPFLGREGFARVSAAGTGVVVALIAAVRTAPSASASNYLGHPTAGQSQVAAVLPHEDHSVTQD